MAGDERLDVPRRDHLAITILVIVPKNIMFSGMEKIDSGHVTVVTRWQRAEAHIAPGRRAGNEPVHHRFGRRADAAWIDDVARHTRRAAGGSEGLPGQPVRGVP